jgi:putative serine protease PepD
MRAHGTDHHPQDFMWAYGTAAAGPSARWTLRRQILAAVLILVVAICSGAAGAVAGVAFARHDAIAHGAPGAGPAGSSSRRSIADIAAAVRPSVVSITVMSKTEKALGSGVVLRSDGTILTNAHVIEGARLLSVKTSAGRTASARVLATYSSADLAVIKVAGLPGLVPAKLGDSGRLVVGEEVLAVGNPLGLDGSVTSGIVSAVDRRVTEGDEGGAAGTPGRTTTIPHAIQTDAAINPGNSGGALVDGSGEVIGINTAMATADDGTGGIGVGFAIPVNAARKVVGKYLDDPPAAVARA